MFELEAIKSQVLQNCDISDARYAGSYSLCGLALRLRDLYKWENGIEPWIEKDHSEILEWVEDKEQKWEDLAEKEFHEINILDRVYDPFDVSGINAALEPYGVYYGGGYARSLKPTFFLAHLESKKEINGYTVYILGRELARDLFFVPALSQDNSVVIRQESAKFFFWDQIFFVKKSGRYALQFALQARGHKNLAPLEIKDSITSIVAAETDTYIYHELGELQDSIFDRDIWREIIASYPHTPVELLARSVKDLLADTNEFGTLQHIIRERKTASLAYYVAFQDGLSKKLFPDIAAQFKEFTQTGDWGLIEQAVSAGFSKARDYAEIMSSIFCRGKAMNDKQWSKNEIESRLLNPLLR